MHVSLVESESDMKVAGFQAQAGTETLQVFGLANRIVGLPSRFPCTSNIHLLSRKNADIDIDSIFMAKELQTLLLVFCWLKAK